VMSSKLALVEVVEQVMVAGQQASFSGSFLVAAQTAAAHTYKLRIKTSAGTVTIQADSVVHAVISAVEEAMA